MASAMFDAALDLEDAVADVVDRHAEAIWLGLILSGLSLDAWLLRCGHRPLTTVARTRTGRCLQALLVAHFAGALGRFDPFTRAAHLIERRGPYAA